MNKKGLWYILLNLIAICGFFVCTAMVVMAARFGELGRVFFYGVLALICAEILIFSIIRIAKLFKK